MQKVSLRLYFILFLFSLGTPVLAQLPLQKGDLFLQGYASKYAGLDLSYHSPIPGAGQAMIVRAEDGTQTMSWQTEALPDRVKAEYITFAWLAGLGCNLGEADMTLFVGDIAQLSFEVNSTKNWQQKHEKDVELSFRNLMIDGSGDQFGFMFLRIPSKLLTRGQSLKLSVTGARQNSQAWYMTFKAPLKPGATLTAFPALLKGQQPRQAISLEVYHFQAAEKAFLYVNDRLLQELSLDFGYNYFNFDWPVMPDPEELVFRLKTTAFEQEQSLTLSSPRKWQVHFLQHSHTDIGYTRPQTEILAEHLRYIDYALDYCDATDSFPDDARFRWTCEASWAVDEYLKSRPLAQIQRLTQRIQEGRIEVTGMYFNFDELPDEQTLAASLGPIKRFKEAGIEVKLAMQNDVNGTGWAFNDYFNSVGIKYLDMGTHGHKALICFDKPTAFWWESPAGKRILAFRSEHYMHGNTELNIHSQNFPLFESKLMTYLMDLEEKGYPHETIMIQHSGYLTDNAPPSTRSCDMIRQWNEKYATPQLRAIVGSEFFEEIEANYAEELPVYRVAWPDWWTDGFGTAAREVAATRSAQTELIAHQGALVMASLLGADLPAGIEDRIAETNKAMLFYGEHTLGSAESVRDPYGTMTMEQREMKESFAWEAKRRAAMLGEEALGILQEYYDRAEVPSILIFNSLSWARSGLAEVYIDHQILPPEQAFRILDGEGREVAAQAQESRSDGTYWQLWVQDVPAMGSLALRIELLGEIPRNEGPSEEEVILSMENPWYRLKTDIATGAIASLYDKDLETDLVDREAPWQLGAFIHEQLANRSQLEYFTLSDYERSGLDSLWYAGYSEGPIWNSIHFRGERNTFFSPNGFNIEIRLYHPTKRVDLVYEVIKKAIVEPEGLYLAFPFQLNNSKLYCEVPGGLMQAGVDQLPGSANDWNTVQNFAAVRNASAQIVWGSKDCPLVQFGGINTGRFLTGATPGSSHIFSWPMNNYWTTNFNADQRGGHRWTYYLSSSTDPSNTFATRFGWGARVPLMSRVLPAGNTSGKRVAHGSLLSGFPDNVLLIAASISTDGQHFILQLRELEGLETEISLKDRTGKVLGIQQVNVIGEKMEKGDQTIGALESAFFEVTF